MKFVGVGLSPAAVACENAHSAQPGAYETQARAWWASARSRAAARKGNAHAGHVNACQPDFSL
jgi:hypothetical protein